MKSTFTVPFSIAVLAIACNQAASEEHSMITSPSSLGRHDCTSVTAERGSGSDAYSAYAGCVLNKSYSAFYALYTRHLRDFPDEKYDVEVSFEVGASGNAERVAVSCCRVTDPNFLRELEARLRLIKFIPPENTEYEVIYTFRFSQPR